MHIFQLYCRLKPMTNEWDFIGRQKIGRLLYVTRPILSADIFAINLAVELVLISPRKSGDKIGRFSSFVCHRLYRDAVSRCVICMGEFKMGDALRFLPCVHIYHKECIDDWLMRSFTCPSCMEPVDAAILTTYEWRSLPAAVRQKTTGTELCRILRDRRFLTIARLTGHCVVLYRFV